MSLPKFKIPLFDIDGTLVEGYAILHPKDKAAKPANPGMSGNKGLPTCYAFLAKDARWKVSEPYLFNPANDDGMTLSFVENALLGATNAWENEVSFDIFGGGSSTSTLLEADTISPDGLNEVYFAEISDPNVIAVTYTWGIFGGAPRSRELREWDMVYNDPNFMWGDAAIDHSVMDFSNIITHELGHAAGLGHPSDSCAQETMYRFANEGETKKRDLNTGDIEGIVNLYK